MIVKTVPEFPFPTLMLPLRGIVEGLAVTENDTVPLLVPLAPEVTLIQGAFDTAVQPHPVPVFKLKLLFPPLGETE